MAGRVRVISDAINDLVAVLREIRTSLPDIDQSRLDARALDVVRGLSDRLAELNRQLDQTNANLRTLAQRPILGMLGGGADQAVNALTSKVDALRAEVEAWRKIVP